MKYILSILLILTPLEARYISIPNTLQGFEKYGSEIRYYANKYNLDFLLVTTIIAYESNFKNVISPTNDVGLMQIHLFDKSELKKLKNPSYNIMRGCSILRNCLNHYKDTLQALTAYNRGIYGAKHRKTSEYAKNVLKNYKILIKLFKPKI